jgi:hypothetical protein
MAFSLARIGLEDFGFDAEKPVIPASVYEARLKAAQSRADVDWLVVYADREHHANMVFLTGFEPRFEEALLLVGRKGETIIITGNENQGYTPVSPLEGLVTLLAQSLSLMAQDRTLKPDLVGVLVEAGLKPGDRIGLVGWKYLEDSEWPHRKPGFFVPAFIVDSLCHAVGPTGELVEATAILMHPATGLRSTLTADAIAQAEWAASRASRAVWRIISNFRLGDSEWLAASRMGYAGEPLTCHPMLATSGPDRPVIGLSSPSSRIPQKGDGASTAIGYWGGLTARAGLITDGNDDFLALAKAYFAGLAAWYESADIGVEGGAIHEAVVSTLSRGKLRSALNPGHLTGHDEWIHSPIRPGSTEKIASGMPFQVDIIPVPMKNGEALNCEDPVTFADQALRAEIAAKYPALSARFDKRRAFVRDRIGIDVRENILLLSAMPLYLMPFWLKPDHVLAAG